MSIINHSNSVESHVMNVRVFSSVLNLGSTFHSDIKAGSRHRISFSP